MGGEHMAWEVTEAARNDGIEVADQILSKGSVFNGAEFKYYMVKRGYVAGVIFATLQTLVDSGYLARSTRPMCSVTNDLDAIYRKRGL
jgi:hypothetical protein